MYVISFEPGEFGTKGKMYVSKLEYGEMRKPSLEELEELEKYVSSVKENHEGVNGTFYIDLKNGKLYKGLPNGGIEPSKEELNERERNKVLSEMKKYFNGYPIPLKDRYELVL